jgi:uncharacterized protein
MPNALNRKDLLLLLLFAAGSSGDEGEPIDGRTRLMKLLFILQHDYPAGKSLDTKRTYNFQAYHFGPFSKELYNDLEFLENVGLVQASSQGDASPIDQQEEEKVVEDIAIGDVEEEGSLLFEQERYKLTPHGMDWVQKNLIPEAPELLMTSIHDIKSKFAPLPLTSLLRYVYSKYPEFAQNTKLKYLVPAQ